MTAAFNLRSVSGVKVGKAAVPSDVYRNPVLENVSIAAFQDPKMFIGSTWFPTVPVTDEAFKYYSLDPNAIARNKMQPRAPGTVAMEGTWNAAEVAGLCKQNGYREKLPEELVASAGPAANLDIVSAKSVAEIALIYEELQCANFYTTGIWTGSSTGSDISGGSAVGSGVVVYWNNAASTPLLDVATQAQSCLLAGRRIPNTLILGAYVLPQIINHPTIIARLNAGQTTGYAAASMDNLAQAFGVDRVLISHGVYNSANENATPVPTFCLNPKAAWLGFVNPAPSILQTSAGYRFAWQGISGNAEGIRTWKYWDQPARSWYTEIAVNDLFASVNANNGVFFTGIVQ